MNKTLASLLVLACLSIGAPVLAQDVAPTPGAECRHGRDGGPFSPEHMERRITHMTERLSLDAHQVTMLREILTSARTQAETIRTGTPGPERRVQFHALMQSTHGRIDAILNDTQRAQFAALRSQMREHGRGRRGHRGGGAPTSPGI